MICCFSQTYQAYVIYRTWSLKRVLTRMKANFLVLPNIRSLRKNIDQLQLYLSTVDCETLVIALTET